MEYEIRWDRKAERFLSKLPWKIARRIIHKVHEVKDAPFYYLERYIGKKLFKLRIGSYRLLVDVDMKEKVVSILICDKRGRVYKR